MQRERIGTAISRLVKTVHYYEKIDADLMGLVDAWQALEADERRTLGEVAPKLVDAVLRVEYHAGLLADVS